MRIAILTHNYPMNSKERKDAGTFLYDFAHELSKKHKVFIFCPNFSGEKEKYKDIPVHWFDWSGGGRKLGSWSAMNPTSPLLFYSLIHQGKKEIVKFCKKNKIDYCLAAWSMPSGVFALEAKQKLNIPYAVWALGSDINKYTNFPILRQLIGKTFKKSNISFANSKLLSNKIKSLYKIEPLFLPAITDFSIPGISPAKVQKRKTNFIMVARLERVKGPDLIIEAGNYLKNRTKNFHIHLLGDGTMRNKLQKYIDKNKLNEFITLHGNATKEQVAGFMKSGDYLVISSRSESLPLVLLESASMGLPVISTDVGDCKRIITKYGCGLVVPKKDPRVLSTVLYKGIKRKSVIKKKAKKGLLRLSKEFTQNNAVNLFLKSISK